VDTGLLPATFSTTPSPCFTPIRPPFWFNASFQLTPLLNLRPLIFGLTPSDWLRTWMLSGQYKSHGEEPNWETCAHCKPCPSPFASRLDHTTRFICIFLFFFCSAHKLYNDTPNRGTKKLTGICINATIV